MHACAGKMAVSMQFADKDGYIQSAQDPEFYHNALLWLPAFVSLLPVKRIRPPPQPCAAAIGPGTPPQQPCPGCWRSKVSTEIPGIPALGMARCVWARVQPSLACQACKEHHGPGSQQD